MHYVESKTILADLTANQADAARRVAIMAELEDDADRAIVADAYERSDMRDDIRYAWNLTEDQADALTTDDLAALVAMRKRVTR